MSRLVLLLTALSLIASANSREVFVNPETGDDANDGSADAPLATGTKAVALAETGDVIQLLPKNAVYRQSIVIRGMSDFTIEGNGVTLDGAAPLPVEGWEDLGEQLLRRKIARTVYDRHLLIVDGKANRMSRTAGKNSLDLFPAVEDLKEGEFRFEIIDEESGWLFVRGSAENLEWSTRSNGIGTGGECSNIVIRNLNARHFLNDGFNIHGNAVAMKFPQYPRLRLLRRRFQRARHLRMRDRRWEVLGLRTRDRGRQQLRYSLSELRVPRQRACRRAFSRNSTQFDQLLDRKHDSGDRSVRRAGRQKRKAVRTQSGSGRGPW